MIKKVMLSIMMVTAVTLFMVSCNNAADNNSFDGTDVIPLNDIEKALLGKYTSGSDTYDFNADRTGNKTSGASNSIRAASPSSFTWSATTDGNVSIVLADGSRESFTFDMGDMSITNTRGVKVEKSANDFTPTDEYLGTWKGKMTVVMGGNPITQDATVIVSSNKIEIPGHGNNTTEYSNDFKWKKYDDGTIIVKGINKTDNTNTKYASVTYKKVNGKLTAYLYISVMKHVSDALDKMLTQTDCYGTWKGTMTVTMNGNSIPAEVVAVVEATKIGLGQQYGDYTSVTWTTEDDGSIKASAKKTADTQDVGVIITFKKENGVISGNLVIPKMAAMGGTAKLTKTN